MSSRGQSQQCAHNRIVAKRESKCEKCGYVGSVEIHHILAFVDGGLHSDDNLILLCYECHQKAHGNKLGHKGRKFAELVKQNDASKLRAVWNDNERLPFSDWPIRDFEG